MLNGGQLGSATAGGAGNGAVQDGKAVGQGTGIANVGPGISNCFQLFEGAIHK